ncbi:carboxymethylenebutenolidase [Niveispirillum lacus]|uniref:Carboxymethylenebutenolidase n=1 Tax=Niveispirillum lacus TaxID=1981099 RepID=A0A255YX39_9PROT|nr:dienelactone hydrolase family protein [Niveispirillum lacus]OYQ33739.1 carboxymethylenebutenolidase [Niveispirillum lacus]
MNHVDAEAKCLLSPINPTLSRRMFAMTTLAGGFALSTLPVSAQTITTPTDGLVAGEVSIPVEGGNLPAYRAKPAGAGPFPIVMVVQEIFGVHEHIKDVCRRFAKEGYLAVATELFARQGNAASFTDTGALIRELVSKVPDAQVMSDLDATAAWAATDGGDVTRLGITGFCWGGRTTWLYAAHNPKLKAGVAWYGRVTSTPTALQPMVPVNLVQKMVAPVLGLYGGKDGGIPMADVERMQKALVAVNSRSTFHVYPDAPHAFHADYRPSYRPDDAKDGWKRCLEWFRANGVA